MKLDRRELLLLGGAGLGACGSTARQSTSDRATRLDALLEAHASGLPERDGAGANHYPMAAEALEAMGCAGAIPPNWIAEAELYAGRQERRGPVDERSLGNYARFKDWQDHFRHSLERGPWRPVLTHWVPRLTPGLSGGALHGILRTAHAVRALRTLDTPARRGELAAGLAYWAARYRELPGDGPPARGGANFAETLRALQRPRSLDGADVAFAQVFDPILSTSAAPPVELDRETAPPGDALRAIVRGAASALLEMLVQEHSRLWLLHGVTAPAAAGLLLTEVDAASARALVAYSRQAVIALHRVYGAPFEPGAHLHDDPRPWSRLTRLAAERGSVHGIKLIEALARYDAPNDRLCRSVAEQWFTWT